MASTLENLSMTASARNDTASVQQQQQQQQQQQYYQNQQSNSRSMSHSNGHYYVNNGSSNKALMSAKSRAASTSVVNERTGLLESTRGGYIQGQHRHSRHGPGGDDSNYEMQDGSWFGWLCCCRWW